jgi:nitrite reductase/ring-hydroxylating ferredoxin subunit
MQPLMNVDWRTLPNAPEPGTGLCSLQELQHGAIREFVFGVATPAGPAFRLIALRHADGVDAYVNQCPHQWLPMNRSDGSFLHWSDHELMCAHHSAVFNLLDAGTCIMGPCQGSNLIRVSVMIDALEQLRIA